MSRCMSLHEFLRVKVGHADLIRFRGDSRHSSGQLIPRKPGVDPPLSGLRQPSYHSGGQDPGTITPIQIEGAESEREEVVFLGMPNDFTMPLPIVDGQ